MKEIGRGKRGKWKEKRMQLRIKEAAWMRKGREFNWKWNLGQKQIQKKLENKRGLKSGKEWGMCKKETRRRTRGIGLKKVNPTPIFLFEFLSSWSFFHQERNSKRNRGVGSIHICLIGKERVGWTQKKVSKKVDGIRKYKLEGKREISIGK